AIEQAGLSGPGEAIEFALTLALCAGLIQLLMGTIGLGFVVDFLSHPVISGFTSAVALLIGLSQLPQLLGIDVARGGGVVSRIAAIVAQSGEIHWLTAIVGSCGVATLLVCRRWVPKVPGALLVVVGATALTSMAGLAEHGLAVVGQVPAGLPTLTLPTSTYLVACLPTAAVIAIISFAESISVAKALARRHRYRVAPNRELLALGAANLAASLTGGDLLTGGLSRTAVNDRAGAASQMAGFITAVTVASVALVFTPALQALPTAVLSAVILTAVVSLFDGKEALRLWRVDRPDFMIWCVTFGVCLFVGVEQGLAAGVGSAILWFAYAASQPHIAVLGRLPRTTVWRNIERNDDAIERADLLAIRIDAPLYFGNVRSVRAALNRLVDARPALRYVVLDCSPITRLDSTAAEALMTSIDELDARGVVTHLATVRGPVRDRLRLFGVLDAYPGLRLFERVHEAAEVLEMSPQAAPVSEAVIFGPPALPA
ncbi:MAG TPA: sodium-independent anion transporter, partial [Myxococcales bacterium]|nr:sodium-independent anion transporter [Myxococcales bacterium]